MTPLVTMTIGEAAVVKVLTFFVNNMFYAKLPTLKQDCPVKLKNAGHTGPQARQRTVRSDNTQNDSSVDMLNYPSFQPS